MAGRITAPSLSDERNRTVLPMGYVRGLLDKVEKALLVAERNGDLLLVNSRAKQLLRSYGLGETPGLNLFSDVLLAEAKQIFAQIESGAHVVELQIERGGIKSTAQIQWMPEPDWLLVELESKSETQQAQDPATQLTIQELLQEREITYRNLLAGSLGRLTDKQQDILEESKDSCERLVRLVSMFLNYSALESGKLVLQLRENDLRDCLEELSKRWTEAFQRKGVKLEVNIDPSIATFRFDYQKVQQAAANLLDNSLKHTPAGGSVTLHAAPHFWERRVAAMAPAEERRRFRLPRPNSVEVSVADSGPGIAAEHHQEIFEDFVRVDRNTSGMGLGLAIAKRLIQAHRGKIWVESESQSGS